MKYEPKVGSAWRSIKEKESLDISRLFGASTLRHFIEALAHAEAVITWQEKRIEAIEKASAIFEKNSAKCAEEFEKGLKLKNAGSLMAHELRTMLTLHPERRSGLYEKALLAWDKATGRKLPSLPAVSN